MSQSTLSTTPSRHFRLRVAAVLCFGVRLLLLALLVAAPLAYWRMGVTDWRMGAGAAGVVLLAFIIAWLAALPVRCVVCTQPALRGSSQPKHPSAAKWLGLSYPARVAWDVLTREYHQCMYCHSRCRNRGPSRKGLGKLASVKTTEWLPDLATLMGPAGVVAVESRKVELVAPVSRLPAQVVEPVLEFPKPVSVPLLAAVPPHPPVIVPKSEAAPSTAPAPPAISPPPAAPSAFPVFDVTPTPVPAMSPPTLPLPVLAFPFQTALAGQPEIGPLSEALSPAAAPVPVVMLPPALPSLPVTPLPGFALDTGILKPAVEPAPPAPVPSLISAPALPVEAVIKVLQEGRASMELAFQSMIDQLRSTLDGASFQAPASPDLLEIPTASFPLPGSGVLSGPTPASAPVVVPATTETVWPPVGVTTAPPVAPAPAPPPQPVFPIYPPLYPVTPPAPEAVLPALSSPVLMPPPAAAGAHLPVRRRPLPAISPNLIAELDSTLAQAFSPARAPEAGPVPGSAPVPSAPLAAPIEVPPAFLLTPWAVPPGNGFAPSPPVSGPDATIFQPEGHPDATPSMPAPFSFLQAVPVPETWPNDDLPDLAPVEKPPMWTRTRGNPSLS